MGTRHGAESESYKMLQTINRDTIKHLIIKRRVYGPYTRNVEQKKPDTKVLY